MFKELSKIFDDSNNINCFCMAEISPRMRMLINAFFFSRFCLFALWLNFCDFFRWIWSSNFELIWARILHNMQFICEVLSDTNSVNLLCYSKDQHLHFILFWTKKRKRLLSEKLTTCQKTKKMEELVQLPTSPKWSKQNSKTKKNITSELQRSMPAIWKTKNSSQIDQIFC